MPEPPLTGPAPPARAPRGRSRPAVVPGEGAAAGLLLARRQAGGWRGALGGWRVAAGRPVPRQPSLHSRPRSAPDGWTDSAVVSFAAADASGLGLGSYSLGVLVK